MYQLFALFMVTDPKTTVSSRGGSIAVVCVVAIVEAGLRLLEVVYAPFYALFLVGPVAVVWDVLGGRTDRGAEPLRTSARSG